MEANAASHAKTLIDRLIYTCMIFLNVLFACVSHSELTEIKALTASWTEHFTGLLWYIVVTFS